MRLLKETLSTVVRRGFQRRAALVVLAWTVIAAPLAAQPGSVRFDRIQAVQGLPVDSVTSILQDRIGFLWVGTQDGLARYDGRTFVTLRHDPGDPESLPDDHIQAFLEDADGDLWIGTRRGLSRWHLDRGVFTHYMHDPEDPGSLGGEQVLSLCQDRSGIIWVGIDRHGLDRLDPITGELEHFRHDPADPGSLSDDRVRAVLEDSRGRLWVGTDAGLNRFDHEKGTFEHFLPVAGRPDSLSGGAVRSIYEDRSGNLWIGTRNSGLNRFNDDTETFEQFRHDDEDPSSLGHDTVRVLGEDGENRLWVGTDAGLDLFLPESRTFHQYRNDPGNATSLSSDRVTAIFQDRGGVLWIGTQGGGLNRVTPMAWVFAHRRVGLVDPQAPFSSDVFALTEDRAGGLWIGTSGGLHRIDRSSGRPEQYFSREDVAGSLGDDTVLALLTDRRGALWVGTLSSLYRFDTARKTFALFPLSEGGESTGVMSLFEDSRGVVWIGTAQWGLTRYSEETGDFESFRHDPEDPTSISQDSVTAIAEDLEGSLWVGTFGGGLNRLRRDERGRRFLHVGRDLSRPSGLANETILSLHVDPEGVLWVGTQAGLHKLEALDESSGEAFFKRYLEGDGLPNDTIYGIHSSNGELWLSTNKGLSRFDPRSEAFENFTAGHGLQANEFNMGAHFKSASGELLFGGVNGFNMFLPDEVSRNATAPQMAFTDFSTPDGATIFDQPTHSLEEIELDYTDSVFTVEFVAFDFSAPEENRYRYMLEGRDDDWIDLGNHPRVTFSKIDPGSYTLRAKGANNDGVWSEQELALRIDIQPPFWGTWWFRLVTFLAVAGVIATFLRARMARLTADRLKVLVDRRTRELEEAQEQLFRRKKLAVLGELAGSVAHELRNPLGAIKNALYLLGMRPPDEKTLEKYLGLIDQELHRSDRIISEFLDWGREAPADLRRHVLQEIVSLTLDEAQIPPDITIEQAMTDEPLAVTVDSGQISRILKNFLSNAVEAMPEGGALRVECARRGEEAAVAIVDSGVGIAEEDISKIFEPLVSRKAKGVGLGLPLSQRYADRNKGRIECESRIGEGSTFRLVLPLASLHYAAGP